MESNTHIRCTITILVFIVIINSGDTCLFGSWNIFSSSNPSPAANKNELNLDKETISVVQQTLVKTLISLGKLKFHCPRENGSYPDKLDCRKYYNCTQSNLTVNQCDSGQGYEPLSKSCLPEANVPLCQKVQKMKDFTCSNGTGLRTFEGACSKFILCTDDGAYASSCNRGDLFDHKLLLCLPESEAFCNNATNPGASGVGPSHSEAIPKSTKTA